MQGLHGASSALDEAIAATRELVLRCGACGSQTDDLMRRLSQLEIAKDLSSRASQLLRDAIEGKAGMLGGFDGILNTIEEAKAKIENSQRHLVAAMAPCTTEYLLGRGNGVLQEGRVGDTNHDFRNGRPVNERE